MKYLKTFLILLTITMNTDLSAQDLKTEEDSLSYAYGIYIANQLQSQDLGNINSDIFSAAIKSHMDGKETLMNMDQSKEFINGYMQKKQEKAFAGNKEAGEAFLAENAKKEGVVTLASGLQYMIMKEGTGPKPSATNTVSTHYHGTLITGEVFDSSVDRGQPASFPVNRVIAGWTEALQLMPVGSKWKLFIPSNLAYGAQGAGGKIGPHSALVFEVELLEIQ